MKTLTLIALVMSMSASPAFAQTEAADASPKLSKCEVLANDWKSVEYGLAMNNARSIGDNSAPRATLRAMEDSNELAKAQMTLQLMSDNKCPLPSRAPSWTTYTVEAMECQTARLGGDFDSPECDFKTWKPLTQ